MVFQSFDETKKWLNENFDNVAFVQEEGTIDVVASLLQFHHLFEGNVYLRLKTSAIVMSLEAPDVDESILKHYGDRGIMEYESVSSKNTMGDPKSKLRLTKVGFVSDETKVVMDKALEEKLKEKAANDDHVQYELEKKSDENAVLNFCWKNAQLRMFGYRLVRLCSRRGLSVKQLRFKYVDSISTKTFLFGSLGLAGDAFKKESHTRAFIREFATLKDMGRVDSISTQLVDKGLLSNNKGYLLRTLCTLIEINLADVDPNLYSTENVIEAFCFHPEITEEIMKAFTAKFHPKQHNMEKYKTLILRLHKTLSELDTGKKKHDDRRRTIFKQTINILDHICKTNYYCTYKIAIGFRLDPQYMEHIPGFDRKSKYPEVPYGIYYIAGMDFFGFQCRFRDLSRGGMRTIITQNHEHARYERSNMFTEVYNLSYTQQKKNKDIPEGGSKAICFLLPNDELNAEIAILKKNMMKEGSKKEEDIDAELAKYKKDMSLEYMYYNQRCFIHTMLTLFVSNDDGVLKEKEIVDHLGVPEYIYLGPDENMHDSMIDWIAAESTRMGYRAKGAFISGKEETGINHKEYGVTSFGCFQFMKRSLEFLELGGKPYTIKITGGPDGDVAGNMIRLMNKHHKNIAKLIVITDGSGTCHDPEGLDLDVLEKMFHEVKAIAEYPKEKLHEGAFVLCLNQTRQKSAFAKETLLVKKKDGKVVEEWVSSNEAYHLFSSNAHRIYADVFAPCGGRPRTLNINNVEDQMIVDGKATCRTMVEGANLYITPDARVFLEERGVLIFQDSSANKCGVISSSYEILGGLSVDDEQFVKIKHELATNVLERLEIVADAEAKCMISYYKEKQGKVRMTSISELVSKKINEYTDQFSDYLKDKDLFKPENKKFLDIFIGYVPKVIINDPTYREQCMKRVPQMHMKAIISTVLATNLVYGRGLSWGVTVVDILPVLLA